MHTSFQMRTKQVVFTTALLALLSSVLLVQSSRNWLKAGYNFLAATEIGAALVAAIGAYIGSTLGLAMGEVEAFLCLELLRRILVPRWKQALENAPRRAVLNKDD